MEPDTALFQQRLRNTRDLRGLTLQQVADGSGLTKSYVWALERGEVKRLTVRATFSLAEALGVSPAYLLGLDHEITTLDPLAHQLASIIHVELQRRNESRADD